MISKNKIIISQESLNILMLLKSGLLYPFTELVDLKTANKIIKNNIYKDTYIPFPFMLTPNNENNKKIISKSKIGDTLDIYCNKKFVGEIKLNSIDNINPKDRLKHIYRYVDELYPNKGVKKTLKNIGEFAISGDFILYKSYYKDIIDKVKTFMIETEAKKTAAFVINSSTLHKGLEYIIKHILMHNDIIIIFLEHDVYDDMPHFDIRYKTLMYFLEHYTIPNKTIVIPMQTPYKYAGYNKLTLDMLIAQNLNINRIYFGEKQAGLNLYYYKNRYMTFINDIKNINIEVRIMDMLCYCIECKSVIPVKTCPHGEHNHMNFNSKYIYKLLQLGIMPPEKIVRKEISSYMLSKMFIDRFGSDLRYIYNELIADKNPIIEDNIDDQKLYLKLYNAYK